MKVIQINICGGCFIEDLVAFLKAENPDIINMQEVNTGQFISENRDINNWEILKKELGMEGFYAPRGGRRVENGKINNFGNAFLTKLEIVDHGVFFHPDLPRYEVYDSQSPLFYETDRNILYAYSFEEPVNYVWCVLKYKGQLIRNITTHFTVSYKCTETIQIIRQTKELLYFIDSVREMPTVFTGDLNISETSRSIEMLGKKLEPASKIIKNTLNPKVHGVFKNEPNGLKVDHVFQKGFSVVSCTSPEVNISDHLPVVAELEFNKK